MLLHTFWREKASRDRRKVVPLTTVVNRAFRIALVDPGYRQRSAEVHGGSRRRSLKRFHLRARSPLSSRNERRGERNRKMSAGTVSRAREACPRSRVRTRLRVKARMWVQRRPEPLMSFVGCVVIITFSLFHYSARQSSSRVNNEIP